LEGIEVKKHLVIVLSFITLFSTVVIQSAYSDPQAPPLEIIVDDPEGTFIGDWGSSTIVSGYYGEGYHYNFPDNGPDTFTWAFDLPYSGQWEVSAMWTNHTSRATNAPYNITHAEGFDIVRVNQEINGGQWNTLGTYTFNIGETTVTLSNDADEYVIADAIKMEYKLISWRARESKEQIIEILNQTHSEEKKIEHEIDKMIDKIDKSLEDKLWQDEYTPTIKLGHKVFDNEKKAIKHGLKIIKDKKTTEDVKEVVIQSIDELISIDRHLADNLYEDASQYGGTKKIDHELEKAHKDLLKAYAELEKPNCKYDKVMKSLKKSWKHSQKAIKHAEKVDN
jgi:hypothetical protein